MAITETDLEYLRACVQLASDALRAGDEPFGSMLVDSNGNVLFEDHNRVGEGDRTRHPEFEIARWASSRLSSGERATSTVYTSGEHCPMCAAAHGWAGLGRIVYATGGAQLATWLETWEVEAAPVAPLPITAIVPDADVDGPVPELAAQVRTLHRQLHFRPLEPDEEPTSVGSVDLERYAGLWYEIGRLPLKFEDDGASEVTAEYLPQNDGSFLVVNRCRNEQGEPVEAKGRAEAVPGHPGQLKVSFLPAGLRWVPFTQADYWILQVDPEYRVALVGTPDRKHLWLLSRTHGLDPGLEEEHLVAATQQGYDLRTWIRPVQTGTGPVAQAN